MIIQDAKRSADIVSVVGRYLPLKKQGKDFVGVCPFHDDHKPSLNVVPSKQFYHCPACSASGDVVDFVSKMEGITLIEAAKKLTGQDNPPPPKRPKPKPMKITPPTTKAPIPETAEYAWMYNESVWVIRMQGKQIRPLTHTEKGWEWKAPTKPTPKYEVGEGELILCEGEKTADAIAESGYRGMTWMGGANRWQNTEWELPNGVMMFPDNDWQGWAAMQGIALTAGINPRFVTVTDKPKGYDAADDSDWLPLNLMQLDDLTVVHDPLTGEAVRWFVEDNGRWKLTDKPPTIESESFGYRAIGFETVENKTVYFFYSFSKKKLIQVTGTGFSKSALFDIVPDPNYWENRFGGDKGINIDEAQCALIIECEEAGIFNPDSIRTRGAWIDRGRVVLHVGPYLIVDGKKTAINALDSEYTYEWRSDMNYEPGHELTAERGAEFIEMLKLYNWERNVNAYLLAGWCAIAPLCGALNWRPHIWITGSSGTGKTKLMKDTVLPLMESIALTPEGESTEAGVRQTLGGDALPVLFDEAEAESRRAQERMEGILNLMRSASSGKSGKIMKGGVGHTSRTFNIKSCFAFSSIVYQASKKADRSRISVLGLERNPDKKAQRDAWDEYNRRSLKMIDAEFINGFHARSINRLREILQAAEVFSKVVAEDLGDRRLGDQIGTMLAGAWMLSHDLIPTAVDALQYIAGFEWDYERSLDELNDEHQLFNVLMQRRVRVEGEFRTVERTIGELIAGGMDDITEAECKGVLGRCGFVATDEFIHISNGSDWIKKALRDTPWLNNHGSVLKRIEGAVACGPKYFTSGDTSRNVKIPRNVVGV